MFSLLGQNTAWAKAGLLPAPAPNVGAQEGDKLSSNSPARKVLKYKKKPQVVFIDIYMYFISETKMCKT